MNNESPQKNTPENSLSVKPGDIINFSSAVFVVVATAIFYFTGWIYAANWYSFFGIDATAINIPIEVILIHGVPGVLTIIVISLLSIFIIAIFKFSDRDTTVRKEDFFQFLKISYLLGIGYVISLAIAPFVSKFASPTNTQSAQKNGLK